MEIGWFRELPEEILDYEPYLNLMDSVRPEEIKNVQKDKSDTFSVTMDFSL